ncbi:ABC transporter permease [Aggregicoccus sp. 17bor-14]|uniref:ABC transporter permease n=1 Tax=Myxococcaceae TaxID=31 RepID=UPI00129CE482|nr:MULTISPECIES: ABC transporter permease [Myxococcaceae]MBF5041511.1 ABC transporter permease [Simulacricoccus sp. 17bor-14]MRI87295.1 ABC transporter permease [Aggregicoccus sp. 17bor-14]
MRQLRAVLGKELKDHARDRRSLTSALVVPLFGPFVFGVLFTMMAGWYRQDRPLELPVVGAQHAPHVVAALKRAGVTVVDPPQDYEAKVQDGTLDAVLVIPEKFAERFSAGKTADLQLVVDNSRQQGRGQVKRVEAALQNYASVLGAQRLFARGVSPTLAAPIHVEELDLATPEKTAASLLNMIPIFLIMAAFVGGMNVAIDATAGERERGSLEPLLLNPVQRGSVVVGKWLATVLMACAAVGVCLTAFMGVVHRVPLQDLGIKAHFDAVTAAGVLLAVLPLTLAASALQMTVATYARSFKEAQTYLQLFLFIPTVPGFVLAFNPVKPAGWMYAVPALAQQLLVGDVMRGEPPSALRFGLGLLGCLALAAVGLLLTTRLLSDERIVFGRSS